jgi:hypothetical protein
MIWKFKDFLDNTDEYRVTGCVTYKGWKQTDYQKLLWNINQKGKDDLEELERDGETKLWCRNRPKSLQFAGGEEQ